MTFKILKWTKVKMKMISPISSPPSLYYLSSKNFKTTKHLTVQRHCPWSQNSLKSSEFHMTSWIWPLTSHLRKKPQILTKGHRHSGQPCKLGPAQPRATMAGALPTLRSGCPLLSLQERLRAKPPGSSLTVGCARYISAVPGQYISPLFCCHFLPPKPYNMNITSRTNRDYVGLLLTWKKKNKNRLPRSYVGRNKLCVFCGKKMHAHSPTGRPQPSPTFRAACLSIKHIRKPGESLP